ncbi:MAG: hypothetical protein M4D80_09980 [Myxococcota bacterium]|nr:hypothetical protein [Myxococcota bacterium]
MSKTQGYTFVDGEVRFQNMIVDRADAASARRILDGDEAVEAYGDEY